MNVLVVCSDDRADAVAARFAGATTYRLAAGVNNNTCFNPEYRCWDGVERAEWPARFDLAFVHRGDTPYLTDDVKGTCRLLVWFTSPGESAGGKANQRALAQLRSPGLGSTRVELTILAPFAPGSGCPIGDDDAATFVALAEGRPEKLPACCEGLDGCYRLLDELAALDVLLQGYLAIHSEMPEWADTRTTLQLEGERLDLAKATTAPSNLFPRATTGTPASPPQSPVPDQGAWFDVYSDRTEDDPAPFTTAACQLLCRLARDPEGRDAIARCMDGDAREAAARCGAAPITSEGNHAEEVRGTARLTWDLVQSGGSAHGFDAATSFPDQLSRLFAAAHRELAGCLAGLRIAEGWTPR